MFQKYFQKNIKDVFGNLSKVYNYYLISCLNTCSNRKNKRCVVIRYAFHAFQGFFLNVRLSRSCNSLKKANLRKDLTIETSVKKLMLRGHITRFLIRKIKLGGARDIAQNIISVKLVEKLPRIIWHYKAQNQYRSTRKFKTLLRVRNILRLKYGFLSPTTNF